MFIEYMLLHIGNINDIFWTQNMLFEFLYILINLETEFNKCVLLLTI